jgi:hypothetical protein
MPAHCKVKFYATTPRGEINKLFKFKVNSHTDALAAIKRFQLKGFIITAGWFETSRNSICGYSNTQIYSSKT